MTATPTDVTVIDASVFVDALVGAGVHGDLARRHLHNLAVLQVPAIFGAEAISAMRTLIMRGELSPIRAAAAVEQIRVTRTEQYPFEPFSRRVWELRSNLTVYDAWYVALAESLGTDLLTADDRLAAAAGPRCPIRRVTDSP
jgi:predicted nucleic acid-binding protein